MCRSWLTRDKIYTGIRGSLCRRRVSMRHGAGLLIPYVSLSIVIVPQVLGYLLIRYQDEGGIRLIVVNDGTCGGGEPSGIIILMYLYVFSIYRVGVSFHTFSLRSIQYYQLVCLLWLKPSWAHSLSNLCQNISQGYCQ